MNQLELHLSWQKALDCLNDSQELLELGYFEAATNRAYYAVYHAIHTFLMTVDVYPKTHQGAHNKFNEHFVKTGLFPINTSKLILNCFEKRQFGDYELEEVTKETAQSAVEDATLLIEISKNKIASFLNSPASQ
ncbi:HEPN domain-containing protein [Runella rosea]|uniref:HEPN domain-containing protein n=1 Tax=Runella rosea TaxID=2259595 RepID=A0A344THK3_9BACT|nr:HEPN domain-containing protein [Runella rosea]AXE18124.1 HEPN domain-containing protein [Runella rosea]